MAKRPEEKVILVDQNTLKSWLRSLDVSETTRLIYRNGLASLERYALRRGLDLRNLRPEDLVAFKEDQLGRLSASTVSTYLIGIRSFYFWAENHGYANSAKRVKGPSCVRDFKKDVLTPTQARSLLEAAKGDSLIQKRNFAMLNLMLRTGLRDIEIARANVGDIGTEAGSVVLHVQGKGRPEKDRFVLLTDKALRPIEAYLANRPEATGESPLFASHSHRGSGRRLTTRTISGIAKSAMRTIGLDSKRHTAHSLRHTAVTFALLGGAKVEEAKEMARHANINTTMIYSHHVDRIQNAAERKIENVLD